ncbi:UvrD-helicase domain-containing protein [candidate division FCPU426 bacterium]|nr:UvrD-helicase domain-containing protein [candidate division FCPU426 bacterium]
MKPKEFTLAELNPPQREAVEYGDGPLLVLAGAGSGKTRVITYRIAHFVCRRRVDPGSIMAVTFTNKAAGEMRDRIKKLLGGDVAQRIWIGTFHALCLRILKREVSQDFSIYDEEESKRCIKECQRELGVDEKTLKVDRLAYRIEGAKHELIDADAYQNMAVDFISRQVGKVYALYQKKMERNHAYDFGDLIMGTVKRLQTQPAVQEKYRRQFRYLLVDEYQDINHSQYVFIRLLAGESGNLTVVGDDDQSIYQFRGADLRNILEFERDYPQAKVIKLEQNYRSTQNILAAASEVVKNNRGRKEKTLWSENPPGLPLQYFRAENEAEEAEYVVKQIIQDVYDRGLRRLNDCVVLYRTNAQSRPFEDALRRAHIRYRIVGGMKFYDRMEIKDILAYLKVLVNPADELSLERIVNVPPRGLGFQTMQKIKDMASQRGLTVLEAMSAAGRGEGDFGERIRLAAASFSQLLAELENGMHQGDLAKGVALVIHHTGYLDMWQKAPRDEGAPRLENLSELIEAADEYAHTGDQSVKGFLEQIALVSSWDEHEGDAQDQVTLMTLHSAKGLEFPLVAMVGMEEGLFPHSNALQDEKGLAEERRLCYVGITRAKDRLMLTGTATRSSFGNRIYNTESRFLHEIPARLFTGGTPLHHQKARKAEEARGLWRGEKYADAIDEVTPDSSWDEEGQAEEGMDVFRVGQRVRHAKYGAGTIVGRVGEGEDLKVEVAFTHFGRKLMMVRFAALQPVKGKC